MPSPQIKDEEQYEALRREGASKEMVTGTADADGSIGISDAWPWNLVSDGRA